jgi:hypothetical protein
MQCAVCGRTRKEGAECGGSPLLQQGELDFSPAENRFIAKDRALAPDFSAASAKAHDHSRTLSRNAEALLPLLKQRAPTRLGVCAFFSRLDTKQKHKTKDTSTHRLDKSPAAEAEGTLLATGRSASEP